MSPLGPSGIPLCLCCVWYDREFQKLVCFDFNSCRTCPTQGTPIQDAVSKLEEDLTNEMDQLEADFNGELWETGRLTPEKILDCMFKVRALEHDNVGNHTPSHYTTPRPKHSPLSKRI